MAGRVEAIWKKRAVRGPMDPVDEATLVADGGIDGDANFGRSKRQVTIIEREVFDRVRASLSGAAPHMRRANFMISGVRLEGSRGKVLALGDVRVLIHGETRPCERMDAQCPGLTAALEPGWGGGAYGVVLDEGAVRVGDPVTLEAATVPA
jgi:MOSC domain-containing protein YiiM